MKVKQFIDYVEEYVLTAMADSLIHVQILDVFMM